MHQEIERAASRFSELKHELYTLHPEARDEALTLSKSIVDPAQADAEAIWSMLWPKPLYAGKQVAVAKGWHEDLTAKMAGVWKQMSYDDGPYAMRRDMVARGAGMGNGKFAPVGPCIMALKKSVNAPPQAYYAMIGAGMGLTKFAERHERPFNHLPIEITAETIKSLQAEFGYGWGHITVMHFLTDLGLCCKPDIHLLNTLRALGLYSGLAKSRPTLRQAVQVQGLVKEMLIQVEGKVTPRGLREIDKNLMDISYHKLI